MFSEAGNYELFTGRWSRKMAPLLVNFAGVEDGERILDAGSGTGSLTAAIAEGRPGVTVVGIDPAGLYRVRGSQGGRSERELPAWQRAGARRDWRMSRKRR